jgi:hypothetical protein
MRVLATIFLSVFLLPSAQAATIVPRDVSYLTANSDIIVRGEVTQIATRVDAEGRAWTHTTIRVREHWKGTSNGHVEVVQLGGALPDGRVMHIDGDLALNKDMDIVIFLSLREGKLFSTLLGWSAFEVGQELSVRRHQAHFGFVAPDKEGRMNAASPPRSITPVNLIDLKTRVRRALGGAK